MLWGSTNTSLVHYCLQVEALTVLIKRGVNVGMEDYDGLKPFDLANVGQQASRVHETTV